MKYGKLKLTAMALLSCGVLSTHSIAASNPTMTNPQESVSALTAGEKFLVANKKMPGVVTLADGLQYKVIKQGSGEKPKASDTVTVNYAGRLINGTEFDSSYKRGEPTSFPVNGVIPGWTEALQLMTPGSTWELYIPAELAYGARGAPPSIGPNETLIFKVDLIKVEK